MGEWSGLMAPFLGAWPGGSRKRPDPEGGDRSPHGARPAKGARPWWVEGGAGGMSPRKTTPPKGATALPTGRALRSGRAPWGFPGGGDTGGSAPHGGGGRGSWWQNHACLPVGLAGVTSVPVEHVPDDERVMRQGERVFARTRKHRLPSSGSCVASLRDLGVLLGGRRGQCWRSQRARWRTDKAPPKTPVHIHRGYRQTIALQ